MPLNDFFLHLNPSVPLRWSTLVHIDGFHLYLHCLRLCLGFLLGFFLVDILALVGCILGLVTGCYFLFIIIILTFGSFMRLFGFVFIFLGTGSAGIWYRERATVQKLLVTLVIWFCYAGQVWDG